MKHVLKEQPRCTFDCRRAADAAVQPCGQPAQYVVSLQPGGIGLHGVRHCCREHLEPAIRGSPTAAVFPVAVEFFFDDLQPTHEAVRG